MVSPFVYEKNNTKLTVIASTTLDALVGQLRSNLQLRELVLLEAVSTIPTSFSYKEDATGLPSLRKLRLAKEASKIFQCGGMLIHMFACTLETIDAWRVGLPEGVCLPRLRYLRLQEGDFYYARLTNRKLCYPNLTYVHIPNMPFVLPFVVLGSPVVLSGSPDSTEYNQFYVNILRNQKREQAAVVLYWCVKSFVGKDVARLLMNWVMQTSNLHWKLSEEDIPPKERYNRVFFTRLTPTFLDLQAHSRNVWECTDKQRSLDRHIGQLEEGLKRAKREREVNAENLRHSEEAVANVVERIKKHKSNLIDDDE